MSQPNAERKTGTGRPRGRPKGTTGIPRRPQPPGVAVFTDVPPNGHRIPPIDDNATNGGKLSHEDRVRQYHAERAAYWNAELAKNIQDREYDCDWMSTFLSALRNSGNVRAACEAAGVSRVVAYEIRHKNDVFREAWDEAKEDALDLLEAVAWKRAQTQSDTLLIFLLKHERPSKFMPPQKVQHSGPGGGAIPLSVIDAVLADPDHENPQDRHDLPAQPDVLELQPGEYGEVHGETV
jgi:hypothetical protein